MAERRKRRHWSDAEKRMVCAQTRFAGVSVSQVARRYDVNANQVFNWLKNPCFAVGHENNDAARFLPVEIIDTVQPEERVRPAWELYRSEPVPVTLTLQRNSRASVHRAG